MAYWKMGVAAFIPNNSFKWGTKVYALINNGSGIAVGASVIAYDGDYGAANSHSDGLVKFLRAGDRVLLGPSTNATYAGATENKIVASVSSTTITLSSVTTAAYADNDPITAIGTNCPGGWDPAADTNMTMGGITSHNLWTLSDSQGKFDRFSAQFRNNGAGESHALKCTLNELWFLAGVYYRMGCYYQFDENTIATLYAHANANSTNFINETIASADTSAWTEYNSAAAIAPSVIGSSFYAELGITDTTGQAIANIDCVYLEHASGTDDSLLGVYTFDDYPDYGSRKYSTMRGTSMTRLSSYRLTMNDSTGGGDKNKKYIISASFKDSPTALRTNLETLIDWQDRGWYLVLHHDIPSVPPNLQGFLTIKDTGLTNWDSNKCSFNLSFEEA